MPPVRRPERSLAERGIVEGPCFNDLRFAGGEKVPPLRFAPVGTTEEETAEAYTTAFRAITSR